MNINIENLNECISLEYQNLISDQWKFLYLGWPEVTKRKNHTRRIISIKKIEYIKQVILNKLGVLPVYFFLIIIFEAHDYRGPYNNIEKGLMLLYYLIENISMDEIDEYIPKSSFHQIYREFYSETKRSRLNKILNYSMANMFSNIKLRLLNSLLINPELFTQVTLHLDGHDTRGIVIRCNDKSDYYSYKLKKSGFRTQVAIDINSMILFMSNSKPCGTNNDGSMFIDMKIENKVNTIDCIALDGGYNLYVSPIISNSDLNDYNFAYPIRKEKNINLNEKEIEYNNQFGSFRSKMEKVFADIGNTFKRLNNKKPIRTTNIDIFNIQFQIAAVLLNIKKFVDLNNLKHKESHAYWIKDNFDFSYKEENIFINDNYFLPNIQDRLNKLESMKLLQQQFLGLAIENDINNNYNNLNEDENMNYADYEIEKVVDHRGITVENSDYLVKWKNYSFSENSWLHYNRFNTYECIDEYWNS